MKPHSDLEGLLARATGRVAELSAVADLYDETHDALNIVADKRWLEHEANPSYLTVLTVRTAFSARDDYKRSARVNREDVEIYETLLSEIASLRAERDGYERVIAGLNEQLTEQLELSTKYVGSSERYREALTEISRLRPSGDVTKTKNARGLVEVMEAIAIFALNPPTALQHKDIPNG